MKRIIIGTVAVMMAVPCFADPTSGGIPFAPMLGGYSCTMTYSCGNGSGNTQTYTNTDEDNMTITVANSNCSKPGDTFSHWNVSYCGRPDPVSNSIAHPGESYNITGCLDDVDYMLCFTAVYASETGENVLTSKPYVDDAVSTRQDKIPAANPSNTNLGETVMTYTGTEGEIGERELFTGGTYDAETDGDKLITASALKSAFTLPETQTTKLVCANQSEGCTLWTITNQTAYGISGNGTTTIDLMSLIGNVAGTGYTSNDSSGNDYDTDGMSNSLISGDPFAFAVDYGDKGMIKGHGRCSSQVGDNNNWTYTNPTVSSTLLDSSGLYCYCTLDSYTPLNDTMTALSAPWVFFNDAGDVSDCAIYCAGDCAWSLSGDNAGHLAFRAAVFNSVQ